MAFRRKKSENKSSQKDKYVDRMLVLKNWQEKKKFIFVVTHSNIC